MYHKFVHGLNRYSQYIAMLLLVIMVFLVFLQIVMREVLNYSFSWTEEAARYMLVWVSFISSGFAYQYGAHISIEVFVNKLKPTLNRAIKIIGTVIAIIFAIILITTGGELVLENLMNKSPALHLPMGLVYLAIPIGALLQILNIIDLLVYKNIVCSNEVSK
ncbi:TRAP transporter small permease [Ureibacillus chungkukjangi]|uniref:TRAP transporter small permease n=1 Tax=Ureibacillus chungkukjangi TaxID=1202712 RepID=UPI0020422A1C|nr:TRAP transporter small permease [Ureibacillus chungkukjangi]MCM3389023.1 TRAP transporter small permease [Ureibacillus chungkukjangi]